MRTERRAGALALLLIGLAALAVSVLLIIPWVVQAQAREVTPTASATGTNPPAQPTNLQASAEHDSVTLTWTASTDQTVTHYAILRRNRDTDASQVFHVIESNAGPETSYTDSSVSASSRYNYRVKAVSPTGVSQWSGYVKADTPAAPDPTPTPTPDPTPTPEPEPEPESAPADLSPTNLTAALAEGGGVALSWTAPAEDTGSVTGYEVLRAVGQGELASLAADTASTATAYTDATATQAGETYAYRVKAVRGEERSQASGQAQVQVPHDPADLRPTGLTASLVENKVTLSWAAPAEDAASVEGYEILRRRPSEGEGSLTTLVADTNSTATTYTDATANEAGVVYVYRVKALRGSEASLWSNFARIELPSDYVPDPTSTPEPESTPDDQAPTNLTAALAEGGGVNLSWTAPAEDADSVTGYEVLRAVGEGELATLAADTASTATTYTDATATEAGETYAYQVKAIRGEDRSQASGQAQVQVPHDPVDLAPTGLTALILTAIVVGENDSTKVVLTWSAPAEDADSVTGYEILRAVGQGELATLAADTGSTTNTYTDATATEAGETYAYQVKAIRGEDRSQASGQAQVQVPHDPVDLAPSNLTAEKVDGGINLSWTAPAEDAASVTAYEVLRAVGEGELATLVADTGSTDTTYTDATATDAEETYAYQVKANRGQAKSQGSSKVIEAPEPPATPENLAPSNLAFEILEDGVELTWDAPAADAESVTGYRVLRRRPNQGENEWLVWQWDTGSAETTYKDGYAQTHGAYYMYRVRALRGDEYSRMTNRVDVRRPEAAPETTAWVPSNLEALVYGEVTLGEEGVTTKVRLTWDAPAEGVEWVRGYEVQRATCDGGFTTLVADTGSTGTAYTDASVTPGETYTYRVRARRPQGLSLTSNTWTILLPGGDGEGACGVSDPELVFQSQVVVETDQDLSAQEFNTLSAAGNTNALGIWSDGTTMWVSHRPRVLYGDTSSAKLFAYNMGTKLRDSAKDFNTLDEAGNDGPRGLWSDGSTMWVVDITDEKIYAYDMDTKARVPGEDFNNLYRIREDVDEQEARPFGIWSNGDIMWVVDADDVAIYAYDMDTKAHVPNEDFRGLSAFGNKFPAGLWGDDTTLFVSNISGGRIYAYWFSNKAPNPPRYISRCCGNGRAMGIWSDGSTMWVSDQDDDKIYTYDLPDLVLPEDMLSVERVTDTMAVVKVDVQALVRQFGSAEPAVSVKVLGTLSGATMYVHPSASYARFLLLGLRTETQYTVIASYGVETRYELGDAGREVFRTDYARLAGIETSGLTHTEATVTVSLAGADVDGRCCFRWYPHSNGDEAEPGYTYYLRHKPSDDTGWSDPVELTFSDFTAEARLTGLDPGAAYDVEVAETETFMPPQGSADSYEGTMTVGREFFAGLGYDQVGCGGICDPYGSLSPTTFELGGVEYSIVELRVGAGFAPDDEQGKLFLTFDRALPDDAAFTLTVGTTEFNSSDATVSERTYNWGGGPSLSNNDSVSVELDFTAAVAFREGATLEEVGAFTTPAMPPPVWEATMTVGEHTAGLIGYNVPGSSLAIGDLSPSTFTVGGVDYSVTSLYYNNGPNRLIWGVSPAQNIPFEFVLHVNNTELSSENAVVISNGQYQWNQNPNLVDGASVDVKLVVTVNICDRSSAVADAIVAATASFDFCHMLSPVDMEAITELDLTGKSGYGLKAGDFAGLSGLEILNLSGYSLGGHTWNQLPVGLFDGLDSLEVLDLSDTNLLNLNRGIFEGLGNLIELDLSDTLLQGNDVPVGVFDGLDSLEILRIANAGYRGRGIKFVDEDIFRPLNTLLELDVRPIRPSDDVLAPLTSLETLNGQGYTRRT